MSNISYLSILEGIGFIFPLLTYPYLIRVLGADLYGSIVVAQAIMAYVVIVINFGFNVSATRSVSENRFNNFELNRIYSSIIYLKLILAILCIAFSLIILYLFNFKYIDIFISLLGLCVQEVFFSVWFFQGVEKMRYITIVSFISRLSFVLLIFLVVKSENDYLYVPIAYSIGGIITSIFSLYIVYKKFHVSLIRIQFDKMRLELIDSIPFFTSRLSSVIMERSNVLLIGRYFDLNMVAVYDLSTKVVSILKTPFVIISQALYPNISKSRDMKLVRKVYYVVLLFGILLAVFVGLFSSTIVNLLGGRELVNAIPVLVLMIWYLPIVASSYILGASTLIVNGYNRAYNISVLYSFLLYIVLVLIFVFLDRVNLYTMTLTFLIPELFVAVYRGRIVIKNKLLL